MVVSDYDRFQIRKILNNFKTNKKDSEIFYNLCFAICAPQTTFKNNRKVVNSLILKDFYKTDIEESELKEIVRPVRFIRKAEYLLRMKEQFYNILNIVRSNKDNFEKRTILEKMVMGMGLKATSHFLRNLGAEDLSIIDTHVIKFLKKDVPKSKKDYLKLEEQFREQAKDMGVSVAELDAFVWKLYSKTDWSEFVY